jgi:hypothetical protein
VPGVTGALAALVVALWLASAPALAQQQPPPQGAGYVSNLSGPLFAVKSDGSRRVLSTQSQVSSGDTLITEDKTYARVRFSDTSEVTLRPGTQFQIENYSFDRAAPEKDNSAFRLFKGALRTVTGLIGRRGSQDAYRLNTATATIGIRGTVFGVTVCLPGTCGTMAPGTYVNVIDGRVAIAPPVLPGVTLPPVVLSAGQFGYVPPVGPAVQLPGDPGIGGPLGVTFKSPDAPAPGSQAPGTPPPPKPPASDCIVRF